MNVKKKYGIDLPLDTLRALVYLSSLDLVYLSFCDDDEIIAYVVCNNAFSSEDDDELISFVEIEALADQVWACKSNIWIPCYKWVQKKRGGELFSPEIQAIIERIEKEENE